MIIIELIRFKSIQSKFNTQSTAVVCGPPKTDYKLIEAVHRQR